ncbi:hypothetical protein [Membranihabitans maritimus]|uniref:hypothetical protein n=1 Tax=Membranihabitans maritimus TaxID=2904244 RepID=UPI001F2FAA3C|nr:hypothetical protein [Membranihabitans maritimus]
MDPVQQTKDKIGQHIEYLYLSIGINKEQFVNAINNGVSKNTVANIVSGRNKYAIDYLIKCGFFFGMTLSELVSTNTKFSSNSRELLINYHKSLDSSAYIVLEQQPSIKYVINQILETELLNDYVKVKDIVIKIENILGYRYSSSSLSTVLSSKDYADILLRRRDPYNQSHYQYKKAQITAPSIQKPANIPSYIKLQSIVNAKGFDDLYFMFELLSIADKDNFQTAEIMNRIGVKSTAQNHSKYINPLINNNLIIVQGKTTKKQWIQITEKGREIIL